MSIPAALTLLLLMLALAAIPSASVALVVSRSTMLGFRHGAATALGIVLGDLVFILVAALGMSALAESMGTFFWILRCIGGAYLIWVGVGLLCSRDRSPRPSPEPPRGSLLASAAAGFLLTLGDVKAILFYASLLPAFVDLTELKTSALLAVMGITVVAVGGVKLAYAYAARSLAPRLPKVTGGLLVGAGTYLILKP